MVTGHFVIISCQVTHFCWNMAIKLVIVMFVHVCIIVGTMSSTSAPSIVDENYCDENIPADKATSEFKVLSPQKSILKDSNVCNILRSSPHSSETLKVVIHIQYLIVYLVCPPPTWTLSVLWHDSLGSSTHTHLTAFCPGLPGWASTRKENQSGFYWSKRQWVAVVSAGPYSSLHLTPVR